VGDRVTARGEEARERGRLFVDLVEELGAHTEGLARSACDRSPRPETSMRASGTVDRAAAQAPSVWGMRNLWLVLLVAACGSRGMETGGGDDDGVGPGPDACGCPGDGNGGGGDG